jgi:hypothetical protein
VLEKVTQGHQFILQSVTKPENGKRYTIHISTGKLSSFDYDADRKLPFELVIAMNELENSTIRNVKSSNPTSLQYMTIVKITNCNIFNSNIATTEITGTNIY